ncbi:hypothetical protein A3A63_03865 [Candidatus Gottesmanbacteria bacterium RIFCSPLOWO2_01_FULL_46_9]|uniref:TraC-like domain-containing protein n=1 Tax=Candidatus Gottesmanbacteria bacterium RIFCSPLOWO2_01_FULL_46_9 TaxID=1798394 RepID=A0A1F6AXZ1_9BACT|nr:MAG: hypothetical protein A3A63_03865 [Candidatus Gottesmanbacteria bacterium RIFCSPLOWO2_01_FULL_46_9]
MKQPIVPIRSSTQLFTAIETVDRDIIMYADGSASLIVTTAAVNFGLLSEKEQDAIIYAYAGLINSLSFPIQILIRTQHKDVTAYLRLLEDRERKQKNPKLSHSIHDYRLFVAATVKEKNVLDKKFYIVIPFSNLELGASATVLFGSKKRGLPYAKSYIFERALTVLNPKRDHLIRLLNHLGLRSRQLTSEQIITLFFTTYNQDVPLPEEETIQKAIGQ